jgi:hypothetical protein
MDELTFLRSLDNPVRSTESWHSRFGLEFMVRSNDLCVGLRPSDSIA